MNILIDTIEKYSGGYITYLKGLLSKSYILEDVTIYLLCSKYFFNKFDNLNKNIKHINKSIYFKSIIHVIYFHKKFIPYIVKDYKIDVLFLSSGTFNFLNNIGIPVVTTCLNVHPFIQEEVNKYKISKFRFKLELMNFFMKSSFKKSDGIIYHSKFAKKIVNKQIRYPINVIIPIGVNSKYYKEPEKKEFESKLTINLLYVSSVFLYKHQWNVIKSVYKLMQKSKYKNKFKLKLIGNGENIAMNKTFNCLNELNNPDYIEFIYDLPTPYENLHLEYKNCDIFVFASTCENLPNNLLEAMASGNPIACSKKEPMTDILGDAAEYFTAHDIDSIANSIENIINNPSLSLERSQKAYEISKTYTWEECTKKTFNFFNISNFQNYP